MNEKTKNKTKYFVIGKEINELCAVHPDALFIILRMIRQQVFG